MQKTLFNPLRIATIALFGLVAFSSCQKESTTGNPPPPAATKIKEFKNGDEFIRFTYNADGSIQKATVKSELNTNNAIVDFTVSYDAQKRISEVNSTSGEKIVPVYENNVMKRADVFDGPVRTSYTNYTWEAGLLKRVTIYLNQGADFEPLLEFDFTNNAAGNPVKTIVMMNNGVPNTLNRAGHVDVQFDTKPNPLYEHRNFLALLWQPAAKNNPVKEEHFAANFTPEDVYNYAYTYKANGLPEKANVTITSPGQPQTTSALNFVYQ
ncbi:MAG: hypothetical protein J0L56_11510 [Chitinophagales bacterium]|nr:hypothetical protein [Chitinophagales bacterium]